MDCLNLKISEKKCFFCKNGAGFKKFKFRHHNHITEFVCGRCLNGLGKAKIQQIFDEIPFEPSLLNYKTEERQARLINGGGYDH